MCKWARDRKAGLRVRRDLSLHKKQSRAARLATKKVNDFAAGFKGMDGPLDFFSAIGQDFCDAFEEEGIAYVAGSVTAEVATSVIPISKLSLLAKSARALKAVDKAADAANVVDKLSDAARASKGVGKLKYTDIEIRKILDDIEGTGFKNHPLMVEYENKVMELKQVGEDMLKAGNSEETVARILHQMRRDLGVEYKNLTPKPLRDYIYEINTGRYKDPLGQPFDDMIKDGKSYTDIIDSASRPNVNIDKLLSGFEDWLRR